jgi:single-stranded-DNA-specific exonuclease
VNIIELIRSQQNLVINAGGHPGAAGLTIETKKLVGFTETLTNFANQSIDKTLLKPHLHIDCELELSDLTRDLYDQILAFEPFGLQNYKPIFFSSVMLIDFRAVGINGKHLKLTVGGNDNQIIDGIGFGLGHLASELTQNQPIKVAYSIELNKWNNREKLQLFVKDIN